MSRKTTNETETVETKNTETAEQSGGGRSSVEVYDVPIYEKLRVSPLDPKDPNDGWSYYWAKAEGSGVGTVANLRLRGYEKVKAYSEGEIPTYGGEINERNEVVYNELVLLRRPKEISMREKEAKIREYRRLANQKEAEFEEQMEREGAERHPNRSTFYFAENPLSK